MSGPSHVGECRIPRAGQRLKGAAEIDPKLVNRGGPLTALAPRTTLCPVNGLPSCPHPRIETEWINLPITSRQDVGNCLTSPMMCGEIGVCLVELRGLEPPP